MKKTNLQEYAEAIQNRLEGKRKQFEQEDRRGHDLERQLMRLEALGKTEEVNQARHELIMIDLAMNVLSQEITAIEANVKTAQQDVNREANKKELVDLGKKAFEYRSNYERLWHEIHGFLEDLAPQMADAYSKWLSLSEQFYELMTRLEPGSGRIGDDPGDLRGRAKAFLVDLENCGVDLPTVLYWEKFITLRSYYLEPLDGPYLNCLDIAHEVGLYGVEAWPNLRKEMSVRHTLGRWVKNWVGGDLRRPYFPNRNAKGAQRFLPKINWEEE